MLWLTPYAVGQKAADAGLPPGKKVVLKDFKEDRR